MPGLNLMKSRGEVFLLAGSVPQRDAACEGYSEPGVVPGNASPLRRFAKIREDSWLKHPAAGAQSMGRVC